MEDSNETIEGIKVVDLTSYLAAPTTGRVLAGRGTDVSASFEEIPRVARRACSTCPWPMTRTWRSTTPTSAKFMTLNLKSETGMDAMMKLLAEADAFLTSNRTKSLVKMGLDYETLHEKFPKLVYAQVTGYGDKGPEKDAAGFDVTCYMARRRVRHHREPRRRPAHPHQRLGDFSVSPFLAAGIAAALYGRTATGTGDRVSVPLQHAGLYTLSTGIISAQYGNAYPKNRREVPNPFNNMYCCADGKWVCVCLPEYDRDFEKICTAPEIDPQEFFAIDPEANICAKVNEKSLNQQVVDLLDANFKKYTQAQILETTWASTTCLASPPPRRRTSTRTRTAGTTTCWSRSPTPRETVSWPRAPSTSTPCPVRPSTRTTGTWASRPSTSAKELGYTDEQIAAAVEAGEVRGRHAVHLRIRADKKAGRAARRARPSRIAARSRVRASAPTRERRAAHRKETGMITNLKIDEERKRLYYQQRGYWTEETLYDVWNRRPGPAPTASTSWTTAATATPTPTWTTRRRAWLPRLKDAGRRRGRRGQLPDARMGGVLHRVRRMPGAGPSCTRCRAHSTNETCATCSTR